MRGAACARCKWGVSSKVQGPEAKATDQGGVGCGGGGRGGGLGFRV